MVKLLCVGDIHLGRMPSRIPDSLQRSCSPKAAWLATIDEAVERQVDAVVLAGDVVDSDNRFFEAYGPLAEGARRLAEEGIRLIGVAGNHDVEVLPRLAREVPGFTLLGPGGTWTSEVVTSRTSADASVRLWGWSFPEQRVPFDPLNTFPHGGADDRLPWLGILHTQLDGRGSDYAPVATARLEATNAEAWLLGHVHIPSLSSSNRVGYLGNLTPLDPTETGVRGPWLISVAGKQQMSLEHLPLAPLRWDRVDVDVSELERVDDVDSLVLRTLNQHSERVASQLGSARALACRLRFVGTTSNVVELRKRVEKIDVREFPPTAGGVTIHVDNKLQFDAREAYDLEELAEERSPPGLLARRILQLEKGGDDVLHLVASARQRLQQVTTRRHFGVLPPLERTDDEIRQALIDQGHRLLEELLAQKSDSGSKGVA